MQPTHVHILLKIRHHRKTGGARYGSQNRHWLRRWGLGLLALTFSLLSLGVLLASSVYADLTRGLPSLSVLPALLDLSSGAYLTPTRFYDRSGEKLLYSLENPGVPRRFLALAASRGELFAPELSQAVVGLVEPGFWQSSGFDRLALTNPQPHTLAEKLASDLLLNGEPASLRRAVRMRLLAAQLVASYGREQVLEWYLNSAYFGRLAYGADTAARLYLGKSASQLNHAEAALLAAVLQAPALNPLDAPKAALERQLETLDRLLLLRVITSDEYQRARTTPLVLKANIPTTVVTAPAFFQAALEQLNRRLGRDRVERGGIKVTTTLDESLQRQLGCLAKAQLDALQGNLAAAAADCPAVRLLPSLPQPEQPFPPDLSASGVVVDVATGEVLALLGEMTQQGETGLTGGYNPGSLLTPLIATAAFARGYSPASLVWDIPESVPQDLKAFFKPDARYLGPMRLRTALANDTLAPLVQLLEQIGATSAWRLGETLGLSWSGQTAASGLLFEGTQTSPLEIARAYSVFANRGVLLGQRQQPGGSLEAVLLLRVEDVYGRVYFEHAQPEVQSILSDGLAYLTNHVLSDEAARWPSLGYPNPLEIGRQAGAKLGRTSNPGELWAAGYTPRYSVVFWLGVKGESRKTLVVPPRAAAGLWHAAMQYLHRGLPGLGWSAPAGVATLDVCDPSGLLPSGACPAVVSEVFLVGSEPTSPDTLYRQYQVNRETGKLATVFTPPALVQDRVFMQVPPEARAWAQAAGIPLPPETYDVLQAPAGNPNVSLTSPALFASVNGTITLRGSAMGTGFSFYRLQIGQGLNPQSWTQLGGEVRTPMGQGVLGEWDTRGQEGLYAVRLVVVRQNQTVETAVTQVTVDNTAPRVRVLSPSPEQKVSLSASSSLVLRAEVTDALGIRRVVWLVDGKVVSERLQPPFTFSWPVAAGEHRLVVKAYDLAGNEGQSETVRFTVE